MSGQVGGAPKTKRSVQNAQMLLNVLPIWLSSIWPNSLSLSHSLCHSLTHSFLLTRPQTKGRGRFIFAQLLQLSCTTKTAKIQKFWFNFHGCVCLRRRNCDSIRKTSVTRMPFKFWWHLYSQNYVTYMYIVYVYICVA